MQTQDSFGRRAGRALFRLFVAALLLALTGAVVVLLSQLNAKKYVLERDGDRLIVRRGRLFPYGTLPFTPSDPRLADAYAPLPVAGAIPGGVVGETFSDREDLDRALFELLAARSQALIASEEREAQQQAIAYLRRAQLLAGITTEQRHQLEELLADAAYFQGRMKLDDARRLVAEAMTQLRLAADSDNLHSKKAHQMVSTVGAASAALEEALRRAVYLLGDTPESTEPADPAPATQDGAAPAEPPPAEPAPHPENDPAAEPLPAPATGDAGGQ